ncbi:uncharacterized protein PgNI_02530 [Pyricularia grisea]|uniref:DUF7587 domain-containing protein n=1 Tax=Pyricularia grisea TaxID=148305 RepID=A0A6P8BFG5_PYRGI|nr:uncharacterized protein PgNI_02530 [Pyricularia grisea]TLD15538.1 hypothetical protein PgNI_02530 [Pyricularia grisea]
MGSSVDALTSHLGRLGLVDPPQNALLFKPNSNQRSICQGLTDVPLYLFRLHTSKSPGTLDKEWARSLDADAGLRERSETDILERKDVRDVAEDISAHLWWKPRPRCHDNFVSWTSSPLLALRYAYYRHHKDVLPLEEIKLCIVRTNDFEPGTFLRDAYLFDYYSQHDPPVPGVDPRYSKSLTDMKNLRDRFYYFGEYLSQGALNIKEKCSIVSMDKLAKAGLLDLLPELDDETASWEWAKWVWKQRDKGKSFGDGDWEKVKKIASLFEPGFRVPMAAALVSLKPGAVAESPTESTLIRKLYELSRSESYQMAQIEANRIVPDVVDGEPCCGSERNTKMLDDRMPEVRRFQEVLANLAGFAKKRKEMKERRLRTAVIPEENLGQHHGPSQKVE